MCVGGGGQSSRNLLRWCWTAVQHSENFCRTEKKNAGINNRVLLCSILVYSRPVNIVWVFFWINFSPDILTVWQTDKICRTFPKFGGFREDWGGGVRTYYLWFPGGSMYLHFLWRGSGKIWVMNQDLSRPPPDT